MESILVADIEELEILDASEIRARRLNAKEIITPENGENFVFPMAGGTVKLSGRDQVSEPQYGFILHEAKRIKMIFKENRTGLDH